VRRSFIVDRSGITEDKFRPSDLVIIPVEQQ
jgi:hypothetical protein